MRLRVILFHDSLVYHYISVILVLKLSMVLTTIVVDAVVE